MSVCKDWFLANPNTALAIAAMAIFLGAFIVVVLRAVRAEASTLEARARLPFSDGETHV